jgi:hypothetical protein
MPNHPTCRHLPARLKNGNLRKTPDLRARLWKAFITPQFRSVNECAAMFREIRTRSIVQGYLGETKWSCAASVWSRDMRRDFICPRVLNSDVSHTIVLVIMIWWNRYEEQCYLVLDSGNTYRILVCTLYGMRVSIYRKIMQHEWWRSTIVSGHKKDVNVFGDHGQKPDVGMPGAMHINWKRNVPWISDCFKLDMCVHVDERISCQWFCSVNNNPRFNWLTNMCTWRCEWLVCGIM